MTEATDLRDEWNENVTEWGNTVTLYNPTLTYNNEKDITAYTLDGGTSTAMIVIEPEGVIYSSEVEGIDSKKKLKFLIKTTESVDKESIIKVGSNYFRFDEGSIKQVKQDDTVIAVIAFATNMLPQEAAKIA